MTSQRRGHAAPIGALAFAALSFGLTQSFVTPLLPTLSREFGVSPSTTAWMITGFLLVASVATPLAGRLGDMFGRVRVLRCVLVLYSFASVMATIAPAFEPLLVARMGQGVGGALFPLAFSIVRERLPPGRVTGAIGAISSMIAVGSGTGVVLVGPVHATLGHRGALGLSALIVVIGCVLVVALVPGSKSRRQGRVDWIGAALLAAGLTSLLLMISRGSAWGWGSLLAIGFGIAATVLLLTWGWIELRAQVPIVNLRLMAEPAIRHANVIAFLFGYLLYAGTILIPAFVQAPQEGGFGFSATIAQSSFFLLPQATMFLFMGMLARLMQRFPGERRSIVLGTIAAVLGQGTLAWSHESAWLVILASALTGAGIGLIYTHLSALLVQIVPLSETGSVIGANNNIRNIGGTIGVQMSVAIVVAFPGATGYNLAFLALALVAASSLPAAILLLRSTPSSRM